MKEAIALNEIKIVNSKIVEGRELRIPKILIVEDDTTYEPFWTAIVERADRAAKVTWATSEPEAERIIQEAVKHGSNFDLIITDIFLSGSRTGIDLCSKFFKMLHGKIIITSSIEFEKYAQFFNKELIRPMYLQKPLVPHECIGAVYSALHENT